MAKPSDRLGELAAAAEAAASAEVEPGRKRSAKKAQQAARRAQALTLKMAGISEATIAERMGISTTAVEQLLNRSLEQAPARGVKQLRELENARLDRAQSAIWTDVLSGDLPALDRFLRISAHRARINGLLAPTQVDLAVSVRSEMMRALGELEAIVEPMIEDAAASAADVDYGQTYDDTDDF